MNKFAPASPQSLLRNTYGTYFRTNSFRINKFLSKNSPFVLHCVAENIASEKSIYKLQANVQKSIDKIKYYFPDCPIVLDSAGFQIANGKFSKEIISEYIDIYYDMLENIKGYHKHFFLDIPPNDSIFDNWDEIYEFNNRSYKRAFQTNVDKGIFVYHTHTKELYDIWDKLFKDYNEPFSSFSIGGVAGGLGTERATIYALLFRIFIERMLNTNRKEVNLHVLGASGGSPYLSFLFSLFERLAKETYDIDINFTTDSAQWTAINQGKLYRIINEKNEIIRITWFSKNLHLKIGEKTREEFILDDINKFIAENNLGNDIKQIYLECGMTDRYFRVINMLKDLDVINKIKLRIDEMASKLVYSDKEKTHDDVLAFFKNLNNGKMTRNLRKEISRINRYISIINEPNYTRIRGMISKNHSQLFKNHSQLKMF